MAYRNVSYSQARQILKDKYAGRKFNLDLEDDKEFPRLKENIRSKNERWERLEVPRGRREEDNAWTKPRTYNNRAGERYSSDEEQGRSGWKENRNGTFRYRDLNEVRELRQAQREGRVKIMNTVPHARERPTVRDAPNINVYQGYNVEQEERKRRISGRIRGENYKLLEELRNRTDAEILEDIILLIRERNLLDNFDQKLQREKRWKETAVLDHPEEDWMGNGPHFDMIRTEKQAIKFARQKERMEANKKLATETPTTQREEGEVNPNRTAEEDKMSADDLPPVLERERSLSLISIEEDRPSPILESQVSTSMSAKDEGTNENQAQEKEREKETLEH